MVASITFAPLIRYIGLRSEAINPVDATSHSLTLFSGTPALLSSKSPFVLETAWANLRFVSCGSHHKKSVSSHSSVPTVSSGARYTLLEQI